MTDTETARATSPRTAIIQIAVLLVVTAVIYLPDLVRAFEFAIRQSEAAHALAAPVLILILFRRRRDLLGRSLGPGSVLGAVVIVLGLLVTFLALWPFNYALPRDLAAVMVTGGIVLAVGGHRTLWHSLPLLLLLMLAVPYGQRINAVLTRLPELMTIQATLFTTENLPGVISAGMDGPDLHFVTDSGAGTVALGEPARWAALFWSCLTIIVFVTFAVIRPAWQIIVLAVASVPIVLICNFARILTWCLASVYGGVAPTSPWPRVVAATVALLLAYLLTILLTFVLSKLIVEQPQNGSPAGVSPAAEPTHA